MKLHPRRCGLIKYDLVSADASSEAVCSLPAGRARSETMLWLRHGALGG